MSRGAYIPQQLGAAISQPQVGAAISQPQVGAAQGSQQDLAARLALSLANKPCRFLPPQGSQQGSQQETSQPQLGAVAQQLGAAISQPQVGAAQGSQQVGAAQGSQQVDAAQGSQQDLAARLAFSLANKPCRFLPPQGSQQGSQQETSQPQLGAISQPQLGAAISHPQVGAAQPQVSQPEARLPKIPALALAGARVKLAARANKATIRTDIFKSPLSDTCQGLVGLRLNGLHFHAADNRFCCRSAKRAEMFSAQYLQQIFRIKLRPKFEPEMTEFGKIR